MKDNSETETKPTTLQASDATTCSVCSFCRRSFPPIQFYNEYEKQMGEICETLNTHPMIDGDTTADSVKLLLDAYKRALHDAIASFTSVVPKSAEELYDQNYYSLLPNV